MSNARAKKPRLPKLPSGRGWRRALTQVTVAGGLAAAVLVAAAGSASAAGSFDPEQFAIESFSTESSDMQAGGHPDVGSSFTFHHEQVPSTDPGVFDAIPYGRAKRLEFDLPAGLVGNPTAFEKCPVDQFYSLIPCPAQTQVGTTDIFAAGFNGGVFSDSAIYLLEQGPDQPVLIGVKPNPVLYATVRVKVHANGKLTAIADELPPGHALVISDLTLWGVPADHNGSGAPRVPFMTAPTECESLPTTTMRAFSYEQKSSTTTDSLDTPHENCEDVPFDPVMKTVPTDRAAGAPTGLEAIVEVPQNDLPDGRASAHVRDVELALPEQMSVSPSSANGLGACSPGEFGYEEDTPIACPDSSKIGSITVDTPVLEEQMSGSVYLAKQNDNPFGSLLALYISVKGAGQTVKLAGRVDPDPVTGQLTTTFRDNPQLPFSRMVVRLKSGPRAPLVNPRECGTYQSQTRISAWTQKVVSATTPVTIDEGCSPLGFSPTFEAGSVNPVAGRSSAFTMSLARGDRDRELRTAAVSMPEGLLGAIRTADQCPAAQADAGTCGAGSRIGSVTTGAGPGSSPFHLPGAVHLTGPYAGAPFGLSFVVPVLAGPFDLGTVVVRAAVEVDRQTAAVKVVSAPLPSIVKGIPVQVRSVDVTIDRPGFMLNPTDCDPKRIDASVAPIAAGAPVTVGANDIGYSAAGGTPAQVASRFQVGDCGALPFEPRLSLALTGRKQVTTGKHPGVEAVVRQRGIGEAGIGKAEVKLPKSLALDPDNAQALCEFADGTKPDLENHCPKGSIVGRARAVTPLLDEPLTGNVYFVKNVRRDRRTGNEIRTLPMLVVALRGEIAINLEGESSTTKSGVLVNTFAKVPDAPISRFNLNIKGGGNGILAVTRTRRARINLCSKPKSHRAGVEMDGQNGKVHEFTTTVKTPCKAKPKKRGSRS